MPTALRLVQREAEDTPRLLGERAQILAARAHPLHGFERCRTRQEHRGVCWIQHVVARWGGRCAGGEPRSSARRPRVLRMLRMRHWRRTRHGSRRSTPVLVESTGTRAGWTPPRRGGPGTRWTTASCLSGHPPNLSRVGASCKPGAVQCSAKDQEELHSSTAAGEGRTARSNRLALLTSGVREMRPVRILGCIRCSAHAARTRDTRRGSARDVH